MENNKYYTPSIEEFHVGFEYEVSNDLVRGLLETKPDKEWYKQIFDNSKPYDYEFLKFCIESKFEAIRVKYLDKEDIESLGFDESCDEPGEWWWSFNGDFEIQLYLNDLPNSSSINPSCRIYSDRGEVFSGFIKNKSELKRLLTQLQIV